MKKTLSLMLCVWLLVSPYAALADATVYFLDVGQGDAAFIDCDGQTMLIDGGMPAASSKIFAFLKGQGIQHIDYIISTHPHEDHVGGLSGALNAVSVGAIYTPVIEYQSKAFESFLRYAEQSGAELLRPIPGRQFSLGNGQVTILAPQAEYENVNDLSILLRLDYGQRSFLFTGDMEWQSEQDTLSAGFAVDADILKLAHHGSDSSSSYAFLRAAMPEIVVISVGEENPYGHPHEAVLTRLRDLGAAVFRTDLHGDIAFKTDGEALLYQTEKPFVLSE